MFDFIRKNRCQLWRFDVKNSHIYKISNHSVEIISSMNLPHLTFIKDEHTGEEDVVESYEESRERRQV